MCKVCQEGEPLRAVTSMGKPAETIGHYFIAERQLMAFTDDVYLQDRIPIRFCPECGTLLPARRQGSA